MLQDFLRDQDGVITLAQALESGLSKYAVGRLVRSGHWERHAPGVFFAVDHQFTDAARVRVAVWSYGPDAVASGLAAAWWLGLTTFAPEVVEVTVPRDRRLKLRKGIRLRRRDLDVVDIVERRGLRTTATELTVIEAAARRGGGAKLLDNSLQRRHAKLPQLWSAHVRNKGRHGSPRARILLQAADDGTRSAAERLMAKLLRSAGITGWKANQIVAGYEVDFEFRVPRVVIEVDGLAYHSDAETFGRDRVKQNAIIMARYRILRFTWFDLTEYPSRVIAEVERVTCGA
jgi:very-short-patch-repair endonuclease